MRFPVAIAIAIVIAISAAAPARAQTVESLVVVGAGSAGSWRTEFDVANPVGTGLLVQFNTVPVFQTSSTCPEPCHALGTIGLAGFGAVSGLPLRSVIATTGGLFTVYIVVPEGSPLPVVRARVINGDRPSQAIELPVVRRSSVTGQARASVLDFPAAERSDSAHSNLAVDCLDESYPEPCEVRVEAFSGQGDALGSGSFSILAGSGDLLVVDVVGAIGIPQLSGGHLRVSNLRGNGVIWGVMSEVRADGGVAVSVGWNP
jgi:hypothetical protein